MATTDNLEEFIQSIVNAVGEKTGDTQINAQDLPDKISSIQSSIKSLEYDLKQNKFIINNREGIYEILFQSSFGLHMTMTPSKYPYQDVTFDFCDAQSSGYKKMSMTEIKFNSDGTKCYATFRIDAQSLMGSYRLQQITVNCGNDLIQDVKLSANGLTIDNTSTSNDTIVSGTVTISFSVVP